MTCKHKREKEPTSQENQFRHIIESYRRLMNITQEGSSVKFVE